MITQDNVQMTDPQGTRVFGERVILCPDCGHGIDPHGTDPGGMCGVGNEMADPCQCLLTPNGIACLVAGPQLTLEQRQQRDEVIVLETMQQTTRNVLKVQKNQVVEGTVGDWVNHILNDVNKSIQTRGIDFVHGEWTRDPDEG